ncbi:MAG: GNAT family N-acetyltransferase [Chloroflexota bacterium]
MDPEIRHPARDELPAVIRTMNASFLETPDADRVAADVAGTWDLDRLWAAFDGDRLVGTYRSFATELTIPGCARLPAAGVAGVSVMPDHRRRGILRRMVAEEHTASRDRGEAVAVLYAAEYAIYGRFGYGPSCLEATWTLETAGAGFHEEPTGAVEIAPSNAATRDAMIAVFEAWRARSPGEIQRAAYRWDYALGLRPSGWGDDWKGWVALHRDDRGAVDGYVRYHAKDHWERRQPRNTLVIDDMHALGSAAYAALWQFVATLDWVGMVEAERRSPAERLPWLLVNARAATLTESGDGIWVRLFDVPRALEARAYERSGRVVLEVVDGDPVGGRARLALDASPEGATCRPTDQSPDLTLDVAALGAAFLGGTRLVDAVLAQGVDEHRSGALAEADAIFHTLQAPWCSTFF